jgi:hypothetical protein
MRTVLLFLLSLVLANVPTVPCWAQAEPRNANTTWFQAAGYGVFVHYLAGLQNNREAINSLGCQTSWEACVHEFDTERFAETMEEVGAGYVVFTVMQVTRHMIAPNETYDRITGYSPGEACATRDLVADLYESLHKRNIPLLLYWTGDGPRADPQASSAFGCRTPVTNEFVQRWAQVVAEYGDRYGEKVAGWWVDGCYRFIGYDDEKLEILATALKVGHPQRIIAFNPGVEAQVNAYSRHEDFTCGEQNQFFDMPVSRAIDGEQWHILSYLGSGWGKPGCQYSKRDLAEYVFDVHQRGGVVSIDVVLFRDGTLDQSQIEVLKAVRHELETGKTRPAVPPGNLAHRKQSKLLSLDGSHNLSVNGGVHFARLGIDGRMATVALAGGEWPWTYEVDLVDTRNVQRIKVTFGKGYATHFELQLSTDGKQWKTVTVETDHNGQPYEGAFEPTPARFVRVCGLQPNGPGQPGSQMSIAELEVYE